jgi:hypothetical protein
MSEPRTEAAAVEEIVPGIVHWRILDERIHGHVSAAHALLGEDGAVLVDPLPLAADVLSSLGEVAAIVVTAGTHQRSAWRYRRELGARVWMPALARQIDEEPDERYGDGDELPRGLRAVFTPGAGTTQHTLLLGERVAFVPDLLSRQEGEELGLVPAEYMHDPAEARRSLERLLAFPFEALCLSHGAPVTDEPHAAIRQALSR